jgi:hypothetical protein
MKVINGVVHKKVFFINFAGIADMYTHACGDYSNMNEETGKCCHKTDFNCKTCLKLEGKGGNKHMKKTAKAANFVWVWGV